MRSRRRVWLWRFVRAAVFSIIATLFTIYWPATVRDVYAHDDSSVRILPSSTAPAYLVDLAGPPREGRRYTPFFADLGWAVIVPEFGLDVSEYIYGSAETEWNPETEPLPPWIELHRFRVGWPFRAAYWDVHLIPGKGNRAQVDAVFARIHAVSGLRIGIERPRWLIGDEYRRVPVVPIAFGLFANAAFFAAVWLFSGSIWRTVRQRRRRSRGRCTACGYELAGLPRCAECGLASPQRNQTPQRPPAVNGGDEDRGVRGVV